MNSFLQNISRWKKKENIDTNRMKLSYLIIQWDVIGLGFFSKYSLLFFLTVDRVPFIMWSMSILTLWLFWLMECCLLDVTWALQSFGGLSHPGDPHEQSLHPFNLGPKTNTRVAGLIQPAAWVQAQPPITDEPNRSPVQSCQHNNKCLGQQLRVA